MLRVFDIPFCCVCRITILTYHLQHLEELYLLFQRDLNVFSQHYMEKLLTVVCKEDDAQPSSQSFASECPLPKSESEEFFSRLLLHGIIDETVDNFKNHCHRT